MENDNKSIIFRYSKSNDKLFLEAGRSFESYIPNTVYMFFLAFNKIRDQINNDFSMEICTEDLVLKPPKHRVFSYSNCRYRNVVAIPDSFFVNWPECHIENYDNTCKEIETAGKIEPESNKLFWIGNVNTYPLRKNLLSDYKDNPNFKFISMNWNRNNEVGTPHNADYYVSLPDHTKYKYLLDIRGNGASGRFKLLLFSNRAVFYVQRFYTEHFFQYLSPFVHYIPVAADLSDLEEKYEWAENNPEKVKKIAKNALDFAQKNLTKDAAIEYLSQIILWHSQNPETPIL